MVVPVAINDRCQHFKGSRTLEAPLTVLDKFVGIPAALQRLVPTNLSLLKRWDCIFLSLKTDWHSFSFDPKRWEFVGSRMFNFLGISVEVQDMVNDVDIDGEGQRMCFCQAAWQWFLWHLVVKLLGGRAHPTTSTSFHSTSTSSVFERCCVQAVCDVL